MIFIMIFIPMNKRTNIQYNFNLSNNMMAKQIKKNTFFQQHRSVSKTNVKLIRKIHLNFKLSNDYK